MSKLNFAVSQSLFDRYQDFWVRYYFKFVLPKVRTATLEGIHLDLAHLPLKIRNRIINVGYEDHEKAMCRDYLKPTDAVLELGGAIGFIGLYCQKMLGIRKYITVEANPKTVELLKKNYQLNGLVPTVWNMAVAKSHGTVRLDVGGDFWENTISGNPAKGQNNTIEVPAAPLTDLLAKAGPEVNTLIIDIEGAEQFIDFMNLPEQIEKIIIELHPQVIGQEAVYNIVFQLISRGFKVAREEGDTFAFLKRT
jgi:FkbM family methyltransferase